MGEFADYALDEIMDFDELQCRYPDWESSVDAGVEEDLYDYDGVRYPNVLSYQEIINKDKKKRIKKNKK